MNYVDKNQDENPVFTLIRNKGDRETFQRMKAERVVECIRNGRWRTDVEKLRPMRRIQLASANLMNVFEELLFWC